MGLPYSKQINTALDTVTPLVTASLQTLRTTKTISLLLAVIQVLTVIFLGLIILILFGILISVNPELVAERDRIVTPVVRAVLEGCRWVGWAGMWGGAVVGVGMGIGAALGGWYMREGEVDETEDGEEGEGNDEEKEEEQDDDAEVEVEVEVKEEDIEKIVKEEEGKAE